MTNFPTHLYTSTSEIPTLLYTLSLKKVPLSGGASPYGHYRELPLPPWAELKTGNAGIIRGFPVQNVCIWNTQFNQIKENLEISNPSPHESGISNSPLVWQINTTHISIVWVNYPSPSKVPLFPSSIDLNRVLYKTLISLTCGSDSQNTHWFSAMPCHTYLASYLPNQILFPVELFDFLSFFQITNFLAWPVGSNCHTC